MKDTHPAIEELFFKMVMERSGEEWLKMGFEMDEMARRLAAVSLLNQNREASERDVKIAIFERFYGDDLSVKTKQRFIKKIGAETKGFAQKSPAQAYVPKPTKTEMPVINIRDIPDFKKEIRPLLSRLHSRY